MSKVETPEVAEFAEVADQAPEQPSLSINDLAFVANIIDLGLKRGAFHGPEASQVGNIYDKVSAFVKHVTDQNAADAKEAEAAKSV